jgi:hypothetical protein
MAFDHGGEWRGMGAQGACSKTGKISKKVVVQSILEILEGGREHGGMGKGNE